MSSQQTVHAGGTTVFCDYFCFYLVVIVGLASSACFTPVRVESTAMEPTFHDGDRLFMSKDVSKLQRFDIVYFRYPGDETKTYIKRIVGLPGDRIAIENGAVKINGEALAEPFIDSEYDQSAGNFSEKTIPADHYYVLGDNRDNSSDSRYWGTVQQRLMLDKYYSTYYRTGRR